MGVRHLHPLPVRITHWLNALVMVGMFMSGWGIYNASPLFAFHFPAWATLGGWLGGSIGWHLAVMWVLFANGLLYFVYSLCSRHFQALRPQPLSAVASEIGQALRLRLAHPSGRYNAVQRLLYCLVLAAGVLIVASGLAIWKPIQLYWLADLFGGFDVARYVHFAAMSAIGAFVLIHVLLVILVPRTLWPMISGGVAPPSTSEARHDRAR
jgi:thiosulfate reductase cytochrome b subunit